MSIKQQKVKVSQTKNSSSFLEQVGWVNVLILLSYALVPVFTPNLSTFDSNGPKFMTFSVLNSLVLIYLLVSKYGGNNSRDFVLFFKTRLGVFYSLLLVISLLSFVRSINVVESVVHFGKIFTTFTATLIIALLLRKDKKLVKILVIGMTGLLIFDSIQIHLKRDFRFFQYHL
jgi:hypothetical protein